MRATTLALLTLLLPVAAAAETYEAQIVVVGGDSGGTGAALAGARAGWRTIVINQRDWLGGMMTSGGIGVFDGHPFGQNSDALGYGLFGEFRQRLADLYPEHKGDIRTAYRYEPAVGAQVLERMAKELPLLTVLRRTRVVGVEREGRRLTAVRIEGQHTGMVKGKFFIDGTDGGDLAALAGVPYRLGTDDQNAIVMAYSVRSTLMRGPNAYLPFQTDPGTGKEIPPPYYERNYFFYVEDYNRRRDWWRGKKLPEPPAIWNPYGNLPILKPSAAAGEMKWDLNGDANDITQDQLVTCLIDDPEVGWYFRDDQGNPIPKRANLCFVKDDPSLDAATREKILQKLERAIKCRSLGLLYFMRNELAQLGGRNWGLCNDYGTEDHLPPQVYQREGRRIVGLQTLTEYDIDPTLEQDLPTGQAKSPPTPAPDSVGVQDYAIDIHRVDLGNAGAWVSLPWDTGVYQVPFGIMEPQDCDNLLVTTAVSATHVAYGSLRMDPMRMLLGQVAACAADLCLRPEQPIPVPELDVYVLQRELIRQGCMTAYFTDVPFDKDANGFVAWRWFVPTQILGARLLLTGFPDRTFREYAPMLRSHFAWMVVKAMQLAVQRPAASPYPDVPPDHFAFAAAATLNCYGLSDKPEGTPFQPDRALTRAELAHWMLVLAGQTPAAEASQTFKDVPPEHPLFAWVARAATMEADGVPLIEPIAPGFFAPDAPARRGEALSALQRVLFPSGMTAPEHRAGRALWAE